MNSGQFDDADDEDETEVIGVPDGSFRTSAVDQRVRRVPVGSGRVPEQSAAELAAAATATQLRARAALQQQAVATYKLAAPEQTAAGRVAAAADYLAAVGAAQAVAVARQKAAEALQRQQKTLLAKQQNTLLAKQHARSIQDKTLQRKQAKEKINAIVAQNAKKAAQKEKELLTKGQRSTADYEHQRREQRRWALPPQRAVPPPPISTTMPKKPKKQSVQPVKKTWALTMYDDYGPIASASRFVGDELQNGLWPSPFLASATQHKAHMQTVAASLQEFCQMVILSSMQSETIETTAGQEAVETTRAINNHSRASKKPQNSHKKSTSGIIFKPKSKKDSERVFFSTLLALREVMTQNNERIFGKSAFEGIHDKKKKLEKSRKRRLHQLQDEQYCAKLLATGVVLAAMEKHNFNDAAIADRFLEVCRKYDEGDEEFTSCLVAEHSSRGVLPNGRQLNPEESIAMHVSFEQARESHPLTLHQIQRDMNVTPRVQDLVQVPEPNVCIISMVERL